METYSFSKVKNFFSCPYAFYCRYFSKPELKDPSVITGSGLAEFGTFCHKLLEDYEKGEIPLEDLAERYQTEYSDNVESSFEIVTDNGFHLNLDKKYYESGLKYFSEFRGYDNEHIFKNGIDILKSEYNFTIPIRGAFLFTGKIDLIAQDKDGNLIVIDHKSKAKFKTDEELEEYARQLYLYSLAIKEAFGEYPKYLMFNMFRTHKWVTMDFDQAKLDEAVDWLVKSVEIIESEMDFEPKSGGFYCQNLCSYRNANFEACQKESVV